MADAFERLLTRAKALKKAASPGGPFAQLADYFGAAEAALKADAVHRRAGSRLLPVVRPILADAWDRSKLAKSSETGKGKLYAAAVTHAVIVVTQKGVRVSISPAADPKIFPWAGAMLWGAVHGPVEKHEIRDTVTGKLNVARSQVATSVLGDRAKRSIKKAFLQGKALSERSRKRIETDSKLRNGAQAGAFTQRRGVSLGEVHVRKPHDFWDFTNGEYDTIVDAYFGLVFDEVAALLAKHKAMRLKTARV